MGKGECLQRNRDTKRRQSTCTQKVTTKIRSPERPGGVRDKHSVLYCWMDWMDIGGFTPSADGHRSTLSQGPVPHEDGRRRLGEPKFDSAITTYEYTYYSI